MVNQSKKEAVGKKVTDAGKSGREKKITSTLIGLMGSILFFFF